MILTLAILAVLFVLFVLVAGGAFAAWALLRKPAGPAPSSPPALTAQPAHLEPINSALAQLAAQDLAESVVEKGRLLLRRLSSEE